MMSQNYRKWNHKSSNLHTEKIPLPLNWNPPAMNSFKINFDWAFHEHATEGAVATILIDATGTLLDDFARTVPASSPLHPELQAMLHALQFFADWRSEQIVLETYCLHMVNMLNDQSQVGWEEEAVVHEAWLRISTCPNGDAHTTANNSITFYLMMYA
ncbi:hypothetical protein NL676_001984 [Syzygium grande]|nr:hypothetical protein NL676_001984 [Syzygium grande]